MTAVPLRVRQYEKRIAEVLEPDLARAQRDREALLAEVQHYTSLRNSLAFLGTRTTRTLLTRMDIGSDVQMAAEVADTSHVMIKTGLGFWVECSLEEADGFIATQEAYLQRRVEQCDARVTTIRTHIQLTLHALGELTELRDPGAQAGEEA